MIKTILSVAAALTLAVPALANKNPVLSQKVASGDVVGNGDKLRSQDPKVKFYTPEATGCMILRECKEDVKQVFSLLDVSSHYDNPERFTHVATEFNTMLTYLNQIGIDVFLADEKYFPVGTRGLYHSKHNRFFLNKTFMRRPGSLMAVMRHEGYHAAQDCMAGTIDNSFLALINPEEKVPKYWVNVVEDTYPKIAWPWEKEAFWAGHTEGMTLEALRACASDTPMWEVYEPTPLTREWLIEKGFITK